MPENQESPAPEESALLQALGITPTFDDESSAPAAEEEKLRDYYRGELQEAERQRIRLLIGKYRSWYTAFGEVVRRRGGSAS